MRAISQNSSTDTVLKRSWATIFVLWLCTDAAFVKNRARSHDRMLAGMTAYRYRLRRNDHKIVIAKKHKMFLGLVFDKMTTMPRSAVTACGHRRDPALISCGPATCYKGAVYVGGFRRTATASRTHEQDKSATK